MRTTLLLFLFLPFWALAQVADDFSDGDFTANPTWTGTESNFIVNNSFQLQSAATEAGEAWLSVPVQGSAVGETEWRFWIREAFSPSGNNFAEVWLAADTADLTQANGYLLRFGAAGNQDAIELYRKEHSVETLVCKGTAAAIASSFKIAVKVERDREGHWTVFSDGDNVGNYAVEASGVDNALPVEHGYFGFYLKYTASNAKKFYFDDVYVGPKIIDMDPPELLGLEVADPQHLLLTFNESLAETALDPQHFHILRHSENRNDVPDTVSFFDRPSKLLLSFAEALPENTNLQLKVVEISDLAGNVMPETIWDFAIYKALENDVVINEIMADPTPVVGLPEWEYIELFNTTDFSIDLKDWVLTIGTTNKTMPSVRIDPLGYLILCKEDAVAELSDYGSAYGFSSFSIANAGATLRLLSPEGTLVSEVSFNDTWYHDSEKKNGGWSLEQIDPFNPCAGTANWTASAAVTGGTPGRVNSVNAPNEITPKLARVSMLGNDMVLLWFDQQMNRASLADPLNYRVEELNINPIEVVCNPVDASSVELLFDFEFQEGDLYTLLLNGQESCSGHPIEADTRARFGIPNQVAPGEVLINEILFDPVSPGVDYVELYNASDKTFDLSELKLGVIKESFPNPVDTTLKAITDDSRLMLPHSYLLLSTDAYAVGQQYACEITDFVDMASFPSYPNSGGRALLMSRQGVVVDQMVFSEKMHYPLLKETKGVSLERVSWDAPSDQPDNWHSAVEAVRFGTPGYQNSMMSFTHENMESQPITIEPAVFSPDGDGVDDNCLISYQLSDSGVTMNAYVFNAEGQMVRHLVKGELTGREGGFVWNGLDNRGNRMPIGIYVVVTEVFDMDGMVRKYKNAVVVASR
ncbi:MAG: lamin tail domain-containing protein [Bacteroidales bacterium]|nr:lamin tail domain-containing protein [Bacteroidales bacterium]